MHEVLMQTSFVNRVAFLLKNYIVARTTKKEETLSTYGICAACHGKIYPGSIHRCMNAGFPLSEGTQDLFAIYIPLPVLSAVLFSHLLRAFLTEIQEEPSTAALCHLAPDSLHYQENARLSNSSTKSNSL